MAYIACQCVHIALVQLESIPRPVAVCLRPKTNITHNTLAHADIHIHTHTQIHVHSHTNTHTLKADINFRQHFTTSAHALAFLIRHNLWSRIAPHPYRGCRWGNGDGGQVAAVPQSAWASLWDSQVCQAKLFNKFCSNFFNKQHTNHKQQQQRGATRWRPKWPRASWKKEADDNNLIDKYWTGGDIGQTKFMLSTILIDIYANGNRKLYLINDNRRAYRLSTLALLLLLTSELSFIVFIDELNSSLECG